MVDQYEAPERLLNLQFHSQEPGYEPAHFDRMMTIDKVAVAMYGCLYDELNNDEEQDLVIAHCLGLDPRYDPIKTTPPRYQHTTPRSSRRI